VAETDENGWVKALGHTLHNATVRLDEYSAEWPARFQLEATRIRRTLGAQAVLIEHVGSTSIPGLAAKPIIDVVLAVPDSTDEASYIPQLVAEGFVLRHREPDWFQHRMFKGPNDDVNLHVFSSGCPEIERMLLFRDWLRSNEAERRLYEETKRELAARQWEYVQDYADAKTAVVQQIMARAEAAAKPR
jgi:GrpB-like predicted nucleotidyltransferase (UPF0157 family)